MKRLILEEKGFTLLEVITVLIVLGILAAIALSRWTNLDAEVYAGAYALKSHLRFAQAQAMNRHPNVENNTIMGITCDGKQYWMFSGTNPSDIQVLPDDWKYLTTNRTIDLDAKKIKFNENFTIYFDNRGIPYTTYTSSTVNTPLTATKSIIVSGQTGNQQITVSIIPQTGYIP
jgi:MSHA pilin protein MshC